MEFSIISKVKGEVIIINSLTIAVLHVLAI